MAQGLQVFDANGTTVFDSSTRTLKIVADLPVIKNTTRHIDNDIFTLDTPVFFITPYSGKWYLGKITVSFVGRRCTITCGNIPNDAIYPFTRIVIGVC